MRGEQIFDHASHHTGMAKLKEWMGDPRPEGMQLSLVNLQGSAMYRGWVYCNGQRLPYLLSLDPRDYRWETPQRNALRYHREQTLTNPKG